MILYESSDLQNVTIKHSKNGDAQFASFLLVFDLSEHGIVQYLAIWHVHSLCLHNQRAFLESHVIIRWLLIASESFFFFLLISTFATNKIKIVLLFCMSYYICF